MFIIIKLISTAINVFIIIIIVIVKFQFIIIDEI